MKSGGRGMDREAEEMGIKTEERLASVCNTPSSARNPLHHRRSQSASGRNLESIKGGTSYSLGKDQNEVQDSKNLSSLTKSYKSQSSPDQDVSQNNENTTSNTRVSLEGDIKQLQLHLHQERSMGLVLERAIGRASSTLSPGHRHFSAQTTALIAEIELLEEEIANREQHVLSLYRSIFEQCVSGPTTASNSGMASPVHSKIGGKKHPSIISSSFCSSKKLPLQPLHVLASVKESAKSNVLLMTKGRHESLLTENMDLHAENNLSSSVKKKLPISGKSYLARTLKEHLYQCPSKISEELVRCMAMIYIWVHCDIENSEKSRTPFLSRSSTSIVLPRQSSRDDHGSSCRSTVEIFSVSNYNHCEHSTYAINNYRLLVEQLERIDVGVLDNNAKLAFWINIYNSLIMHAHLVYGVSQSSLRRIALFNKAAYNVGGQIITANSIEHSILFCRTPRMGRWFETVLSTAMRKKCGDEKQLLGSKFGLLDPQPLVLFSLCTGAYSDPMLRVYTAKNVMEELEKAKKEFIRESIQVKKSKKVFLPRILERYAKEASVECSSLLAWVTENVDEKLQEAIQRCIDSKGKKKISQVIEWLPYNTRFRYVFAEDLKERPS